MSYIFANPNPLDKMVGDCVVCAISLCEAGNNGGSIRGVGGNEFLDSCEGCERDKFFDIMSEHFEAMKILHPKEYRAVLERLSR